MNRSELRRIWRTEKKRNPALTWTEYLHRLTVAKNATQAIKGE